MITYTLQKSNAIRVYITLPGYGRFRYTTNHKASGWNEQRATGKTARIINTDLDRIEEEVIRWYNRTEICTLTKDQIKAKLKLIVDNKKENGEVRKTIDEYFADFLDQKSTEVNPATNRLMSDKNIQSYRSIWKILKRYKAGIELEDFTKLEYHRFLKHLLSKYSVNHSGKVIRRIKTFLYWCDNNNYPVSHEYKFWKAIREDTTETDRALNTEQLNRIYKLKIDPVEVWRIAKRDEGKHLTPLHVNQLCASIEEARRQAIAMASLGPHKEDFWRLTDANVYGNLIKYRRGKNNLLCIAPFRDNQFFHAVEYANLNGGPLYRRLTGINYYLKYVRILCDIPFKITASNFRKTFGSIIYYEFPNTSVNKLAIIMKAYGHKKESTTRKYLGIQEDDLLRDHEMLFNW